MSLSSTSSLWSLLRKTFPLCGTRVSVLPGIIINPFQNKHRITKFQVEGASSLHHCHHHHWLVRDVISWPPAWLYFVEMQTCTLWDRCYVHFFLPQCFLPFPLLGWNRFWPAYQVNQNVGCFVLLEYEVPDWKLWTPFRGSTSSSTSSSWATLHGASWLGHGFCQTIPRGRKIMLMLWKRSDAFEEIKDTMSNT